MTSVVNSFDQSNKNTMLQNLNNNSLYRAQSAAGDVFQSQLFPCYTSDYIGSQGGFKGQMLWCYGKVYNIVSVLNYGLHAIIAPIHYLATGVFAVGDFAFGWAFRPIADAVLPINQINGYRHFVGIPRSFEKVLGDWVFFPMASYGKRSTNELLPGSNNVRISDKVNEVLGRLKDSNEALLNPEDETTKFDYRAKTVHSTQVNAFAVPAGGMVVFTQIVKEIDSAIKSNQHRDATIEFADGSKATVDLSGVTLEDTLAALMGHEMTHVASRHSIVSIISSLMRKILLSVGRIALIAYLKSCDQEYQELPSRANSKGELEDKEDFYSRLDDFFAWVEDQIDQYTGLFNSRTNEYEADVTGAYFAASAQYNPLGAIYLQEVLNQNDGGLFDLLHKHFEFAYTHPYGENRKRAIFAAINEIKPKALAGRVTWDIAQSGYDYNRSSPALKYAHDHS